MTNISIKNEIETKTKSKHIFFSASYKIFIKKIPKQTTKQILINIF